MKFFQSVARLFLVGTVLWVGGTAAHAGHSDVEPHLYGTCVERNKAGVCIRTDHDISARQAYTLVMKKGAVLVDVRTPDEYALVGHPASEQKIPIMDFNGKPSGKFIHPSIAVNIPYPWIDFGFTGQAYQIFQHPEGPKIRPTEDERAKFIRPFTRRFPKRDRIVIFICRSGHRSAWAANLIFSLGYKNVYQVVGGFEGEPNVDGYRSQVDGWRAQGLPYTYRLEPGFTYQPLRVR